MSEVTIYADGGARGNPGPAAIGYVIRDAAGRELVRTGRAIGRATNNVAEYRAVIAALEAARRLGARVVRLCLDSELLVKQLTGRYAVRSPTLRPLHEQAIGLLNSFERWSVHHIPRAMNALADRLVNEALDRQRRSTP